MSTLGYTVSMLEAMSEEKLKEIHPWKRMMRERQHR